MQSGTWLPVFNETESLHLLITGATPSASMWR